MLVPVISCCGWLTFFSTFHLNPCLALLILAIPLMFSLTHDLPSIYFLIVSPHIPDSLLLASPECGHAYSGGVAHQEHLPPPSSQVPESTERAPAVTGTSAQTYLPPTLQATQQPTRPGGALFLDKKLIHADETTTSSVGHSLEARPEAGQNKKRLEENVGPTAETPAMVPVLSLLAISFILTAALLYVVCKRKNKKSPQCSPGTPELRTPPLGAGLPGRHPDPSSF